MQQGLHGSERLRIRMRKDGFQVKPQKPVLGPLDPIQQHDPGQGHHHDPPGRPTLAEHSRLNHFLYGRVAIRQVQFVFLGPGIKTCMECSGQGIPAPFVIADLIPELHHPQCVCSFEVATRASRGTAT